LPEGHVDILIKEAVPIGVAKKIVVELKLGKATRESIAQLKNYMKELGRECIAGVLIAESVPRRIREEGIHFLQYGFEEINLKQPQNFVELLLRLKLNL